MPKVQECMLLVHSILLAALATSCSRIAPEAPARTNLDSTLVVQGSVLNVPVYYPVKELENMINAKLDERIIDARLPISKGNDSLFLSISRFEPVTLAYDGAHGLTYTLPVQLDGHLESKVAGIAIRNKEPIRAKIVITMFSNLFLDDNWNLKPETELKDIRWVEEPKIKIAGIKFNLKPPIEKQLLKNKQKIVDKIDSSAGKAVKIRESIEKLWVDIQKPIRINRKVVDAWLKFDATDIDAHLTARSVDTIMIDARLNMRLSTVLDSAASLRKPLPLPRLKRKVEPAGIEAHALVTLPFSVLNGVITQVTDTMQFNFKGRSVRIESAEVYGAEQGIAIRISLKGDVNADVFLRGTVGFDSLGKQVVIDNFRFDIGSEESLVQAADWLVHDEIINRLKPYMVLPLDSAFRVLPTLITKGIEKGKLGRKIEVRFADFDLSLHQQLVTRDNIQIIVSVKGKGEVQLEKGLFDKKKAAK